MGRSGRGAPAWRGVRSSYADRGEGRWRRPRPRRRRSQRRRKR
jgi:hypothetical protein